MASKGRNTATRDRHRRIIRRGEPPCWICGEPINYQAHHLDPASFTIDHVTPLAITGPEGDVLDNLRPAHRGCNRAKGQRVHQPIGCSYQTERSW